jgi:hypothetical protein
MLVNRRITKPGIIYVDYKPKISCMACVMRRYDGQTREMQPVDQEDLKCILSTARTSDFYAVFERKITSKKDSRTVKLK